MVSARHGVVLSSPPKPPPPSSPPPRGIGGSFVLSTERAARLSRPVTWPRLNPPPPPLLLWLRLSLSIYLSRFARSITITSRGITSSRSSLFSLISPALIPSPSSSPSLSSSSLFPTFLKPALHHGLVSILRGELHRALFPVLSIRY